MWSQNREGKVRYFERFKHPLTEKEFTLSCTFPKDTAANRKKAHDVLFAKFQDKTKSISTDAPITLEQLINLYLEDIKSSLKPSTVKRNSYACDSFKALLGKDVLVSKLNANYVKDCLFEDSNGKYNEKLKRFKALMRWAYQNDYIDNVSWVDKLKSLPDPEKKARLKDKFLEKEELKLLIDSMEIEHWKLIAKFSSLSGMRIGEIFALEKSDVDFKNHVIHVTKNYDATTEQVVTPKTSKSVRDVYMQPELENVCLQMQFYTAKQESQSGVKSDLFMHDINGEHLKYYSYNKYLKNTSISVLGRKITTHVMRHTHVAMLAQNNVPMSVISDRLGHDGTRITQEIYFHVSQELKNQYNSILQNVSIL